MGSAFTMCCTAASPRPSVLGVHTSSYRLPHRRLLQRHRHGQMRTVHLQEPATLECKFPGLPGPRCGFSGQCILLEPLSTSHAHGCIRPPGTRGSRTLGSHVSSVPQGSQGGTCTSAHTGGRNRSLALPPNCARQCCVHGLRWTKSWVTGMLPVVTSAIGNRCFGCLR